MTWRMKENAQRSLSTSGQIRSELLGFRGGAEQVHIAKTSVQHQRMHYSV
jgi:hypothetical protein